MWGSVSGVSLLCGLSFVHRRERLDPLSFHETVTMIGTIGDLLGLPLDRERQITSAVSEWLFDLRVNVFWAFS